MKKLAKLTALFAGICFVLAISACSHSGSSSGSGSGRVEVLSLTDGEGTFTFYSDMSFYYEEVDGDDLYCLKGTYTGDASKDGTLTLTVTEEYDEGWYNAEEEGGFIFEVSGDSATCRKWWMEDGKQVVDDEATTFTKGSSEEYTWDGTIVGTWQSHYEWGWDYIVVLGEDGSYEISQYQDGNDSNLSSLETGTYAEEESSNGDIVLKLKVNESNTWGYYFIISSDGTAVLESWWMSDDSEETEVKGENIKKSS